LRIAAIFCPKNRSSNLLDYRFRSGSRTVRYVNTPDILSHVMPPSKHVRRICVEPLNPKNPPSSSRRPSWSLARGRFTQLVFSFVLCTAIVAGSHLLAQDFKSLRSLRWPRHESESSNSRLMNLNAPEIVRTQPLMQTDESQQWPSALHNSSLILVQSLAVKLLRRADVSESGPEHDNVVDKHHVLISEPPVS